MKKLFSLMFALVFANQVFAMETEVVAAVAPAEGVFTDELTRSVVIDETDAASSVITDEVKSEVKVFYKDLKASGLTDAQIVEKVEETLCNETTENTVRSILDKHNQEKVVWALVGAVAGILVFEGGKWALNSYKSAKAAKTADKPAAPEVAPAEPVVE